MAPGINCSATRKAGLELVEHAIDMDELDLDASELMIYRVPKDLRKLNKEAYTPQLISIGPLHFGHEQLKLMQRLKARYFKFFLDRVNDEKAMNKYKRFLKRKEEAIRHCYAVEFPGLYEEQFVDMLLLDAVFIMELLLRNREEEYEAGSVLNQTWLNKSIQRDLLLLENQIPFFILDKLYTVVPDTGTRFIDLVQEYFVECLLSYQSISDEEIKTTYRFIRTQVLKRTGKIQPLHFTDLIRYFYLSEDLIQRNKGFSSNMVQRNKSFFSNMIKRKKGLCSHIQSATKLKQTGVSFEKVNRHLLDIRLQKVPLFIKCFPCLGFISRFTFCYPCFQIPQLKIDHTTECVLRNLIAFEQCHYADEPYICNYVSLFDSLIRTKDDFKLLVEKEIIFNTLGRDPHVATLMNDLCKNVVTNRTCYQGIIDEMDGHYNRKRSSMRKKWNRNMATLRLVYFRDLWRASSTIIGVVIFIFTILNFYQIIHGFLKNKE